MKTAEEIMREVANNHSYETWGDLMYDCHEDSQREYTKEVALLFHSQFYPTDEEIEKQAQIEYEAHGIEYPDSLERIVKHFRNKIFPK